MSDPVIVTCADGVLNLTLNRPDKRNALNTPVVDALHEHLDRADLDPNVAVVAIRGDGKDFCAGADLEELLASIGKSASDNARNADRLGQIFVKIRELPKPVVCVVHGRALAGGCGLATACDIVLAHEQATFGYPEIQRGFVPAMVMAMLRRAVGEKMAFDLVATGRLMSAMEARDAGLISRVIPASRFETTVAETVRDTAQHSGSALALIKRQLYQLDGMSFRESIRLGTEVNALARGTPDFERAIREFLGAGTPDVKGRA